MNKQNKHFQEEQKKKDLTLLIWERFRIVNIVIVDKFPVPQYTDRRVILLQ